MERIMRRSRHAAVFLILSSNVMVYAFVSLLQSFSHRPDNPRLAGLSEKTVGGKDSIIRRAVNLCDYMDLSPDDFPHLNPLWSDLLDRFQGDFDNYHQVVLDRKHNKLPREGGGHEHIHCTLVPVTNNTRLAAFYFDGTPQAIFRFRFYQLVPASLVNGNTSDSTICTILYTLHPDLERQLRAMSLEPLQWPATYLSFTKARSDASQTTASDPSSILPKPMVPSQSPPSSQQPIGSIAKVSSIHVLPRCEVQWSYDRDETLHAYAAAEPSNAIHAVMVHGQALVDSQMSPGQRILIKDQLSLWPDALWIHDRGFHPETMEFIYGNRENVPYKMERVSVIHGLGGSLLESLVRDMVRPDLQWTLGPHYRTPAEYDGHMGAIGGPSIPPRPSAPPASKPPPA